MPEYEEIPEKHIYRAYGIYLLGSHHRLIRRLKTAYAPNTHGHELWDSSFLLMDYMLHNPVPPKSRIIEIGCGWGAASVFCAHKFDAYVIGVDVDDNVFPFLTMMAGLNHVEVGEHQADLADLSTDFLGGADLVMGADICFWDRLVVPVCDLVARAIEGGVARVVIADPGRPTFYELVDRCKRRGLNTALKSWYAVEPTRMPGEVLEVRGQ